MPVSRIVRTLFLLAATLLGAAPAVWSQTAEETARRPFRGLFGAGDVQPTDRASTTLSVAGFAAFDHHLQSGRERVRLDQDGVLAMPVQRTADPGVRASLIHQRPGKRFQLGWMADGSARRYSAGDGLLAASGQGALTLAGTLTRHTSIRLAQRVDYSPQYLLRPSLSLVDMPAGDAIGPAVDEQVGSASRIVSDPLLSIDSEGGFTYANGDRTTFSLDYGYRHATSPLGRQSLNVVGHRGTARFAHRIARDTVATVGYGIEDAEYYQDGFRRRLRMHDVDVGANYRRGLSLTRHTRLNAAAGTTLVRGIDRLEARLTGTVDAVHEFGRTWTARLAYDRGVHVLDQVAAPALTDTVAASARGSLNRRLNMEVSADFTVGHVGAGAGADAFESLRGRTRLQYALTRRLALFADYELYQHRFATAAQLPTLLTPKMRQSSARAGLMWRAPILR